MIFVSRTKRATQASTGRRHMRAPRSMAPKSSHHCWPRSSGWAANLASQRRSAWFFRLAPRPRSAPASRPRIAPPAAPPRSAWPDRSTGGRSGPGTPPPPAGVPGWPAPPPPPAGAAGTPAGRARPPRAGRDAAWCAASPPALAGCSRPPPARRSGPPPAPLLSRGWHSPGLSPPRLPHLLGNGLRQARPAGRVLSDARYGRAMARRGPAPTADAAPPELKADIARILYYYATPQPHLSPAEELADLRSGEHVLAYVHNTCRIDTAGVPPGDTPTTAP